MNWKLLISTSFLKTKNPLARISKVLSISGMAVGCFSLIVALSVMNGFESLVKNKLKGFQGDLQISGEINSSALYKVKGIDKVVSFIERKGVIESKDNVSIVTFKAIDINNMENFYDIPFNGNSPKNGEIMIGNDIAVRLNLNLRDSVLIYSPLDQNFGFGLPIKKKMVISGIFSSKVLDFDNQYSFIQKEDGMKLFKRKLNQNNMDVRVSIGTNLKSIKTDIYSKIGKIISIKSWVELNQSLIQAMKMEKIGTSIILSLIFVVASFNLAISLSLNSIQNLKEIGLLKSIGVSERSIQKIIIIMGFQLAGIGVIIGIILALSFIYFQNKFGFIPIPSEIYFLDFLPMSIDFLTINVVFILSMTFILIVSLISGKNISKISIKEALQWTK